VGPPLPSWEPAARALLAEASRRVPLLGWLTPDNLASELHELCRDWERGNERAPRFRYRPVRLGDDLQPRLQTAAKHWADRGVLGELYAGRARELLLEIGLGLATERAAFVQATKRRFGRRDRFDDDADDLSRTWLAQLPPTAPPATVRSDDESDPGSLLRRLRTEVKREGLAVEVKASAGLAALAATGQGVIYVVADRQLAEVDVTRTVLHEVHGHALPRARGARARLGLFEVGTAHGRDDQEGRALALEDAAGLLDGGRRLELGLRHAAARSVEAGAPFVDTARALAPYPVPLFDRLRIASRTHRGWGLARERVYLPAYLRVLAARTADPAVDEILARGQVAVETATRLRDWSD
jgi:hypothetical protein